LPGESLHGFFDVATTSIDLIVLFGNTNVFDKKSSVYYDTRLPGVSLDKIADCARVDKFPKIAHYSIACQDRNILLKYKGNGFVEPRRGDAIQRVGLVGRLTGNTALISRLDYSTNIPSLTLNFMLST
jgi:hypothetical protein